MTETISRLSPDNIPDPIFRAELYREIREGQTKANGWTEYIIKPDERLRPELAGYRVYGSDNMKWVVMIAAGLDDMRKPLQDGVIIKLPPASWIRERIVYWERRSRNAAK